MNELNHTTLRRLKKQHQAEIKRYTEDYFERSLDAFPERVRFSSNKRNLRKMGMSLWLACAETAIENDDDDMKNIFLEKASQAGILPSAK